MENGSQVSEGAHLPGTSIAGSWRSVKSPRVGLQTVSVKERGDPCLAVNPEMDGRAEMMVAARREMMARVFIATREVLVVELVLVE